MDNIEPVSRIEQYLDRMANGGSGDLPTPVSRIEQYLNQIALGGGSGGGGGSSDTVILHRDANTGALDKTWQEIHDSLANGKTVLVVDEVDEDGEYKGIDIFSCVEAYWNYEDVYYVTFTYSFMGAPETLQLTALSADGYPE